jgi:hypothetical protein
MTRLTELQAMAELRRKSELWSMVCTDNRIYMSVTAPGGPITADGLNFIEALNSAIVKLRLAREDAARERAA